MALYATVEERLAVIGMKSRAMWRNPEIRPRLLAVVRANAEKARAAADCLRGESLEQLLREYLEPDPRGLHRFRYSVKQLAKRYLIDESTVYKAATRHGIRRNRPKRKSRDATRRDS